jgi:ATP-dependent RNA helicase DDX3X
MADNLRMGSLSINDHAQGGMGGGPGGRTAYIPPHLRGRSGHPMGLDGSQSGGSPTPPPTAQNTNSAGLNASAWGPAR